MATSVCGDQFARRPSGAAAQFFTWAGHNGLMKTDHIAFVVSRFVGFTLTSVLLALVTLVVMSVAMPSPEDMTARHWLTAVIIYAAMNGVLVTTHAYKAYKR